jgi:hypothetical protein
LLFHLIAQTRVLHGAQGVGQARRGNGFGRFRDIHDRGSTGEDYDVASQLNEWLHFEIHLDNLASQV